MALLFVCAFDVATADDAAVSAADMMMMPHRMLDDDASDDYDDAYESAVLESQFMKLFMSFVLGTHRAEVL